MKNFKPILNILLLFLILPISSYATIFNAVANSGWHQTSTWDKGQLPGAGDAVVINGYNVTFDNNAGDVTIKSLEIKNSANHSFLTIDGNNSLIILDDLVVNATKNDKDVDLKIQGSARLIIQGNTYLNSDGVKELMCELKGSSTLTILGNLLMTKTAGGNFMVGSTSSLSHFQVNGNVTLTNSGGTGYFVVGAGQKSGSFTVNGNVNLNSNVANKMAMLASSGPNAIVEVKGNISMSAVSDDDAKIYMDDKSILKLGGEFQRPTNYGTLIMDNTSTLVFNGSNPQIVPPTKLAGTGTDSLFITTLSLKNTSTAPLVLQGDLRVKDALILNNGNIVTSETAMLYIEDNATVSGGSKTAYIEGPMVKMGRTDGQNFTFPIGSASNYAPISISTVTNASSEIKAEYFGDPPPWDDNFTESINNINGNNYWSIDKNAGDDVKVTIHWNEDIAGGITELDDLVVVRLNETSGSEIWENYGNSSTTGTTTSGTVTSNSLLGDPPPWDDNKFTLGSISAMNALPVELTKFQAVQQTTQVYMQWETASERNTSYFEIERSDNGFNFESIGNRSSNGDTNIAQQYSFNDLNPKSGLNYYRLKIVDLDGSFEYSHIEVVKYDATPSIKLFPNPVKDVIHLKTGNLDSEENIIEIFDRNGRLLFMDVLEFQDGELNLDADRINIYENGTYFIRISGKTESQVLKFIKIK